MRGARSASSPGRSGLRRSAGRITPYALLLAAGLAALGVCAAPAAATDGTWRTDTSGNWGTAGNWVGNVIPLGAGSTADFSAVDITLERSVQLDISPTVGHIIFGDTTPSNNWAFYGGGTLTLDTTFGAPTVTVLPSTQTVTINPKVAGNDGLTKDGPGTLVLAGTTTYTGTTTVQAGTLSFGRGRTFSSPFTISSGATLRFTGADTFTFNAGASLTGNGSLALLGIGTATFNDICNVGGGTTFGGNAVYLYNTTTLGGTVTFSAGTLGGSGAVTVNGAMNWTGGNIISTGSLTVENGGPLSLVTPAANLRIDSCAFTLAGGTAATWTGTGILYLDKNAVLTNGGTFDVQNDSSIARPAGPTGTATFNNSNSGLFKKSVGTGTTTISVPFNNSGTVQVQSGTLALTGGGTSSGTFTVGTGAKLNFGGTHSLGGATFGPNDGTINFNTGTYTFASDTTIAGTVNLTLPTLTGAGKITFTGTVNWASGYMSGSAGNITRISPGATLNITGATVNLNSRTLENAGTIAWTSSGSGWSIVLDNDAAISNSQTFDCQGDASINRPASPTGGAAVNNTGTFKKSSGTGTTTVSVPFNSSNTVQVQTGTLSLAGGGTSSGSFSVSTGAALNFAGGTHNLGTCNFTGGGTTTFTTGTLAGNHTTIQAGTLNWTGGTMGGATGDTTDSHAAINVDSSANVYLRYRTLNNAGTISWTGTGYFYMGDGAILSNSHLFDAQSDAPLTLSGGTAAFNNTNTGTFRKSAGTGTKTVSVPFNNSGTVQVQKGSLRLTGGGTLSGTFDTSTNATLRFNSGTYDLGLCRFTGATGIASGVWADGGTLTGASTTIAQGTLNWTGGTMTGNPGDKTWIGPSSTFNIDSSAGLYLNYRTIYNSGVINWSGTGALYLGQGAVINNSGTFDCKADISMSFSGVGTTPAFNNTGTFKKSWYTGTTNINIPFNSSSTVQVETGTLALNGGGTSSGTFNIYSEAALNFAGGTHYLGTCTFTGLGTASITGGTTVIAGPYMMIAGGTLNWLAGYMAGSAGDQTQIKAGATLKISATAYPYLRYRTLYNYGTTVITNWGYFYLDNGAVFNSEGTFDWQDDGYIAYSGVGGTPAFNNSGLFKKSAGLATSTVSIPFSNSGTVDVQTQVLSFTKPVTWSGGSMGGAGAITFSDTTSISGAVSKTGAGPMTFNGPQTPAPGSSLAVGGGTVTFNTDAGGAAANRYLHLTASGTSALNFTAAQHLADLTLNDTSTATLASGRNLVTQTLSIAGPSPAAPTAKLDLATGFLVVDYDGASPLADIRQWILAGRSGGTWLGKGITSSAAAANPALYALGYIDNALLPAAQRITTFGGESVDETSILVRYTWACDLNLDGQVTDADVTVQSALYEHRAPSGHYWWEGDLNGDGKITDADVTILSALFPRGPVSDGAPVGLDPIPEPATLALVALGLAATAARRRRTMTASRPPAVMRQ